MVLRSCSSADAEAAVASGAVLDTDWHGEPAWALAEISESEELLADGLLGLAEDNRLAVVVGADPGARRTALARALGQGVPSVVLDDAHRAGLDEVLAAVEDLPEDAVLALSLDQALPLGPVTGAVALDVAAAGVCPVLAADSPPPVTPLARARAAVAAGRWLTPDAGDRSLVLVAVGSPDEALHRVTQLVSVSIPRAFDTAGDDVAVLALDDDGPVGAGAIRAALDAAGLTPTVTTLVESTTARWRAVVVVLPGVRSPALTRAALYAGLRAGGEHVSVVHGFGPDAAVLGDVVSSTSDRPRRTRLADLLRG